MAKKIVAKNLDTELMIKSRNGDAEGVKALIEAGALVDEVDQEGRTAFIHSGISAKFDSAKLLLNAGADINLADNFGNTVTHYLCNGRSTTRSIRFLEQLMVKRKANLQAINKEGLTPLMITAKSGYFEFSAKGRPQLAKILIDGGVDVNLRNAKGLTALQVAISNDNEEMAALLVEAGAGPRKKSDYDWDITLSAAKSDAIKEKYAAMLHNQDLLDSVTNNDKIAVLDSATRSNKITRDRL